MDDLSLSDVARLARGSRPVVTMWTKHPKDGLRFPEQDAEGRVDADELVDWLEATGRGNNPDARTEVALHRATSPGPRRANSRPCSQYQGSPMRRSCSQAELKRIRPLWLA